MRMPKPKPVPVPVPIPVSLGPIVLPSSIPFRL